MIEALLGAGIVWTSMLIRRLTSRSRTPKAPKPICGCEHHLSMHDPKTGACHDQVRQPSSYNGYGTAIAFQFVPCTCKQYVGPITPELMLSTFQPRPEIES